MPVLCKNMNIAAIVNEHRMRINWLFCIYLKTRALHASALKRKSGEFGIGSEKQR